MRLDRGGELTTVRIPSEPEESGRDVVRCRGTLQRDDNSGLAEVVRIMFESRRIDGAGLTSSRSPWAVGLTTPYLTR